MFRSKPGGLLRAYRGLKHHIYIGEEIKFGLLRAYRGLKHNTNNTKGNLIASLLRAYRGLKPHLLKPISKSM